MAQSLPSPRQGFRKPQPQCAGISAACINPPDAAKALQSGMNFPDRTLRAGTLLRHSSPRQAAHAPQRLFAPDDTPSPIQQSQTCLSASASRRPISPHQFRHSAPDLRGPCSHRQRLEARAVTQRESQPPANAKGGPRPTARCLRAIHNSPTVLRRASPAAFQTRRYKARRHAQRMAKSRGNFFGTRLRLIEA